MAFIGSWLLIDTVPVGIQARHGYRHTFLLPKVCVRGHPVVVASNKRSVLVGPRVRG